MSADRLGPLVRAVTLAVDELEQHLRHDPMDYLAGEDQMDRCRCDLDKGHKGEHECRHTRAETKP